MIAIDCGTPGSEGLEERPAAAWPVRMLLALFAFAVAIDVTLATRLGSGGAASLVASAVLGAPLVLAALWHLAKDGRLRGLPPPLVALVAFVGWSALSICWASADQDVITRSITNAQLLAFVWLGWQTVRTKREVCAVLAGFVAGCMLIVALTWRAYAADEFVTYGRYAAEGFDPNDMGVYVALGIPMAAYLALAGGRSGDLLALLYLPVAMTGIALSGSRTGLLTGSVAAAAVVVWVALRSRFAMVLTLALVAGGITIVAVSVPAGTLERLFSVQTEVAGGTIGDRTDVWRGGFELFAAHPVVGVGAGGFATAIIPAVRMRIVAHSTPLSIAVELGAVGLLLFFGALALVATGVLRRGVDERALAWILVLTWCVGTATLTWEFRKPTWFVFLLGAVLGGLPPGPRRT